MDFLVAIAIWCNSAGRYETYMLECRHKLQQNCHPPKPMGFDMDKCFFDNYK